MNSTVLDKIQGLKTSIENGNSIEFDLDKYISKFIEIINTEYNDKNQTITEKINYLTKITVPIEYNEEKMNIFLDEYYNSLKGAIEKTNISKPTELVRTDVVIGDINNTQPNLTLDDTTSPLQNKRLDKFNGSFGQKQDALGCGRHALNNLLGGAYFTGYKTEIDDSPYKLDELKDIIENISDKQLNLHKLCKYLNIRESNTTGISENESSTTGISENESCPADENYNITVLMIALGLIGFEINNTFQLNEDNANKDKAPDIDDPDVFGLLINIDKAHWVSVRKYETKKTETEKTEKTEIYYMDSLARDNVTAKIGKEALNLIIMKANNTTYTIINTGERRKVFIHLKIDDFITNKVDVSKKQIFYNNLYSNYIKEFKDEEMIDNLYSKEFQYNKELISLIENDINNKNYGNEEKILKLLLGESKTKNDTQKNQYNTRSKNPDLEKK